MPLCETSRFAALLCRLWRPLAVALGTPPIKFRQLPVHRLHSRKIISFSMGIVITLGNSHYVQNNKESLNLWEEKAIGSIFNCNQLTALQ